MFIDIENSYPFIHSQINEKVGKYGFNNSVKIMIYDFYPIISEYTSVVPASPMQPQLALIEFRQSPAAFLTSSNAQIPALSIIPYERYVQDLNMYKQNLQNIYPAYQVTSKPDKVMYNNYKNTVITKYISGIVGVDVSSLIDERPLFKCIPPEGFQYPLSREMYYVALKRLLPECCMSEVALDGMYQIYLELFGLSLRHPEQIPPMDPNVINLSLSFPDSVSMSNFISSIAPPNINAIEIQTLVSAYPNVDIQLRNKIVGYINTMAYYGIRESIAIRMLLYHPLIFNDIKNELMTRAGFRTSDLYPILFLISEERLNLQQDGYQTNINFAAMENIL